MHILTFLRIFHLVGLVMGLGGAVLLDYTILKHGVLRPISKYTLHQTEQLSRAVTCGLIILWITGIALIAMNVADKPEYITNQKLWAKIVIVVLLTVNGIFIHSRVLPFLRDQLGNRVLDNVTSMERSLLSLVGSVSFTSWMTPFILGKASELNYVTPMWLILLVYTSAVLTLWGMLYALAGSLGMLQKFALRAAASTVQENASWENGEQAEPARTLQTANITVARPQLVAVNLARLRAQAQAMHHAAPGPEPAESGRMFISPRRP